MHKAKIYRIDISRGVAKPMQLKRVNKGDYLVFVCDEPFTATVEKGAFGQRKFTEKKPCTGPLLATRSGAGYEVFITVRSDPQAIGPIIVDGSPGPGPHWPLHPVPSPGGPR
jgi:hypothetical protein